MGYKELDAVVLKDGERVTLVHQLDDKHFIAERLFGEERLFDINVEQIDFKR